MHYTWVVVGWAVAQRQQVVAASVSALGSLEGGGTRKQLPRLPGCPLGQEYPHQLGELAQLCQLEPQYLRWLAQAQLVRFLEMLCTLG